MKIRKFNESADKEIDAAYVRYCFADFIDAGNTRIESKESAAYGKWVDIEITLPKISKLPEFNDDLNRSKKLGSEWVGNQNNSVAKAAENLERQSQYLREIESCIARIADEYPDYSFKIYSNGFYGGMNETGLVIKIWS